MKAMILAAGLGTRLLPYTRHTPKPLFTLNQRPVLDRILDQLHRAGCRSVMINTHHLHERIEAHLGSRRYPVDIHLRHEPDILGTGGAIRNVAAFWAGAPLLVINADIVTDIDLAEVYAFHGSHSHAVTMVMHDHAQFNSVRVADDARITGFDAADGEPDERCLAFTGIHVMEQRVLDFLPSQGPAHIIDAYAAMINVGETISAMIVRGHHWNDIGTPDSYKAAALEEMAPAAFENAFGRRPAGRIQIDILQGDGSDRRWQRLRADGNSLILADHGIRSGEGRQEVDAFVDIGRHLRATGASVPGIVLSDTFSGLVFMEDLGDRHLQEVARQARPERIKQMYRQVIDRWLCMAVDGGREFDPEWTWQSSRYDRELVLNRECRYFVEAFLNGYMGERTRYEELSAEFEELADQALQKGVFGFMHRDLQSRNIMIQGDRIGFIDFQGGRVGPLQYDLASLLIDPYVALPAAVQADLKMDAAQALLCKTGIETRAFLDGYLYCALTRNLQMLGAFGFLSRVKNKPHFEAYIPRAVSTLHKTLGQLKEIRLPRLTELAQHLVRRIEKG